MSRVPTTNEISGILDAEIEGHNATKATLRSAMTALEQARKERAELVEALRPFAANWNKREPFQRALSASLLEAHVVTPQMHTFLDEKRAAELLARMEEGK